WMHWPSWRWLLVLEAVPAIVCGVAAYFALPSRPAEANFLDDAEKNWVESSLKGEEKKKREAKPIGTLEALAIPRVWHAGLMVFSSNCGVYMLAFWTPLLLKSLSSQISNSFVGLLAMIPYVVGFIAMVSVSRSSDRLFERRLHAAIPAALAG